MSRRESPNGQKSKNFVKKMQSLALDQVRPYAGSSPTQEANPPSGSQSARMYGDSTKRSRGTPGFRTERFRQHPVSHPVELHKQKQDELRSRRLKREQDTMEQKKFKESWEYQQAIVLQQEEDKILPAVQTSMNRLSEVLGSQQPAAFAGLGTRPNVSVWPAGTKSSSPVRGTRPAFVVNLEKFLEDRLQQIRSDDELEYLGAHLDTLRLFSEGFPTYKPVLSRIVQSLEEVLSTLGSHREAMDGMRLKLEAVRTDAEQKRKKQKNLFKERRSKMEEELDRLQSRVDQLELDLEAEKTAKQSALLDADALRTRCDVAEERNKAFASGYKYLMQTVGGKRPEDTEDPLEVVTLIRRIEALQVDMSHMQVKMKNLFTPDEFAAAQHDLMRERNALRRENETMEHKISELTHDLQTALEERASHRAVAEDHGRTLEKMRAEMTPKPDWSEAHAKEIIECMGITANRSAAIVKDYSLLLHEALSEAGRPLPSDPDRTFNNRFFPALGKGTTVPQFLRAGGNALNRRLSKAEVDRLMRDVWEAKLRYDRDRPQKTLLSEYLSVFFRERQTQVMIAEWGLNLVASLDRYVDDPMCDLFGRILIGNLSEDTRVDIVNTITGLRNALAAAEKSAQQNDSAAFLPLPAILEVLRSFFPAKPIPHVQRLEEIVTTLFRNGTVTIAGMFEDPAGKKRNAGPLVDEIQRQQVVECVIYADRLQEALSNRMKEAIAAEEAAFPGSPDVRQEAAVSIFDLKQVILDLEPEKPMPEVIGLCSRAFELPPDEMQALLQRDRPGEQKLMSVPLDVVMVRLRRGLLKRTTPGRREDDATTFGFDVSSSASDAAAAAAAAAAALRQKEEGSASGGAAAAAGGGDGDGDDGGEDGDDVSGAMSRMSEDLAASRAVMRDLRYPRKFHMNFMDCLRDRAQVSNGPTQGPVVGGSALASPTPAIVPSSSIAAVANLAFQMQGQGGEEASSLLRNNKSQERELRDGPRRFLTGNDLAPKMLNMQVDGGQKEMPQEEA